MPNARVASTRPTENLKSAAKTEDSVRCAEETVTTDTSKSERSKELMTGVFGRYLMRTLADLTTMGTSTLTDLLM